jgi:hypothetical protein
MFGLVFSQSNTPDDEVEVYAYVMPPNPIPNNTTPTMYTANAAFACTMTGGSAATISTRCATTLIASAHCSVRNARDTGLR